MKPYVQILYCHILLFILFNRLRVLRIYVIMSVGTIGGDVFLWDLGARQRITEKGFDVWKLDACTKDLQVCLSSFWYFPHCLGRSALMLLNRGQESLNADATAAVNHVAWSPDGTLFGMSTVLQQLMFSKSSG